jgi:S-adenosylmethionine hydrolase
VNPDVGAPRDALAVLSRGQWFLAPDNGVLSRVLAADAEAAVHLIDPARLGRPRPSSMGLDVLAPAAARLATGWEVSEFADRGAVPLRIPVPQVAKDRGVVRGEIEFVDQFGNAWSNITRDDVAGVFGEAGLGFGDLAVHVGDIAIRGIADGFGRCRPGDNVALFNGPDLLEIAVNRGSAAARLNLSVGLTVRVTAAEG